MFRTHTLPQIAFEDFARLREHAHTTELTGKTILLSGATGFFGAWLLAYLQWLRNVSRSNFEVIAISRSPAAFLSRHPWVEQRPWLSWIEGDIRSFPFPARPVDLVIHAATDTSAAAGNDAASLLDSVYLGTRHVLECAAYCQAKRVLLVSSGAVYGVQPADMPLMHEDSLQAASTLEPRNAYAEGKRVMEMLGAIYAHDHDAAVVTARCFAFVGAGLPLDAHFAIGNFIRDAQSSPSILVRGGGYAVRSYLYAADLAVWLVRMALAGQSCRSYNVGSDSAVTIAELATQVSQTLDPEKKVVIEGRDGASPVGNRYVPSIARARTELGLDVWTDLAQAIRNTARYQGIA
jgi:nucleoside-diphosphate-sugar epimerase